LTAAQRRWLRRLPAAAVAVALLILLVRTADTPDLPHYEVPEGFTPAPPPSTTTPGGALPVLATVPGSTTTVVPANVGTAHLAGTVNGPQGPVPGATVRVERFVGDTTQPVDVLTGPDGRYDLAGIGGGRYRVRAFLPPTLAMAAGEVFFLADGDQRTVDLTVDAFDQPRIAVAFAPDPPLLGDAVNVAVRVTGSVVDADGFVTTQPVAGATVQLTASGGLAPPSPLAQVTAGDGAATFTFTCRSTSATSVQASVRVPGALPGTAPATASATVPACVDPTTLTTTTTTTEPSASTTTELPSTTTATTEP
jgi:hypothetical protein